MVLVIPHGVQLYDAAASVRVDMPAGRYHGNQMGLRPVQGVAGRPGEPGQPDHHPQGGPGSRASPPGPRGRPTGGPPPRGRLVRDGPDQGTATGPWPGAFG